MKVGDIVRFKQRAITKGGVQKRGIILEVGMYEWNMVLQPSVRCMWDYPGVGIRWAQKRWLEIISEAR